jgi:hypothetical protein
VGIVPIVPAGQLQQFRPHQLNIHIYYTLFVVKPVFHSRISPPLAKNFATEKLHLLFFRAVNERSNIS